MTAHAPKRRREAQPLHVVQLDDALLKLSTASAVAGLSVPTLYRLAKSDPTFPKFIKMGQRCTRIRAGDLTAWLAARAGA
ncbi:MAG: AlpA family phage regulatory protein [Rubrivivax sp.]|nr:AlpA family phage regulatory protein [Rubrivivax sp.]